MRSILLWPVWFMADLAADIFDDIGPRVVPITATGFTFNAPGPNSRKDGLTPKQITWCDRHLTHFKSMREQAARARRAT